VVSFADASDLERMVLAGTVTGGMRPKIEACVRAAEGGVARTHILDGRAPDALLLEVFTGAGCGTMIVRRRDKEAYADAELAR
jgi:acetylglutamate kinase